MGTAQEDFERAVPDLAKIAFDDPSWRTNPRMPLIGELADLLRSAYRGRGSEPVAAAEQLAHASSQTCPPASPSKRPAKPLGALSSLGALRF
jgi:acetaldehyde dehydrogenase/alcohol dehydrogenase